MQKIRRLSQYKMSSGYSPSLADRLVTACWSGDLPSAAAALADGASVREKGTVPGMLHGVPLSVAVYKKHHDVVVWLLSHGADPNSDAVMAGCAYGSTPDILQLLIDAGGDVNRCSAGEPPLFPAVRNSEANARVLVAQPSLDFAATSSGRTAEQYARVVGKASLADTMAQEVGGGETAPPAE